MASVYADPIPLIPSRNPAYALFAAFLASIFFLDGAAANTLAILCFVAAWVLIITDARSGILSIPRVLPTLLVFLIAINLRLLLPPYGDDDTVPGTAVSRGLLLIGLFGLSSYVYARLQFQSILWLLTGAAFGCTIIALGAYAYDLPADARLTFLGKATHPILGAGAIATGVIASITLLAYDADVRRTWIATALLALVTVILVAAIYLAGSRGPALALAFAACSAPLVIHGRSRVLLFVLAAGAWALVTATVLLEEPIQEALCPMIELACRASNRHDVWAASVEAIVRHPLWGSGYGFRFAEGEPHAHNTYLGTALHYGIPLLILFVCLMAAALWHAAKMKRKAEKYFVVATLIFANGFMGSDLSDPVRFFSTHYLFLWFPLFLAFAASSRPPLALPLSLLRPEPRTAAPLAEPDQATFYAGEEKG